MQDPGYSGLISERHAKGIRKLECAAARDRWDARLARVPRKTAPRRRNPWLKFWHQQLVRVSGELFVAHLANGGRRPSILHLFLDPMTASDGPQGFQLLTITVQFDTRGPKVNWTPIHVTGHAIERLQVRGGGLRTVRAWVGELRPALVKMFHLEDDYLLLDQLSSLGPDWRFHVPTETGYARFITDGIDLTLVTWFHELDLSDSQRIEASMQAAEIKKALCGAG